MPGAVVNGRKDDKGKPRWSLIPLRAVASVVDVLEYGAKKYAPDNWRKVPQPRERYFNAAVRHLYAWRMGDPIDGETGLPALAHACCCILFLLAFDVGFDPPLDVSLPDFLASEGDVDTSACACIRTGDGWHVCPACVELGYSRAARAT